MALSKLRRKTNRELSDEAIALQGISVSYSSSMSLKGVLEWILRSSVKVM